jgi:hypothetical protein
MRASCSFRTFLKAAADEVCVSAAGSSHLFGIPGTQAITKAAIVDAITHDRIAIRQVEADASPQGQWSMKGWGDLR